MWNLAYGSKDYDIGHGRDPFFKYRCPETRCYATADRDYLDSVDKYDAILFHQRSFDFKDLPAKRSQHQRYFQWIFKDQFSFKFFLCFSRIVTGICAQPCPHCINTMLAIKATWQASFLRAASQLNCMIALKKQRKYKILSHKLVYKHLENLILKLDLDIF